MRIAHLASEVHPFAKTGGLADVTGALPGALAVEGHAVTVVTPAHRPSPGLPPLGEKTGSVSAMGLTADVRQVLRNGVCVLLLDCPELFERPAPYGTPEGDYPDNHRRFAFMCRAALQVLADRGGADILHVHDWQAALAPVLLRHDADAARILPHTGTLLTIHNLAYQGVFPPEVLEECGLTRRLFTIDVLEYWGQVSFLKGGLMCADALTTVSPTYASEILTPTFGHGLEGVLYARRQDLTGILNGLDDEMWNPASDRTLPLPFGPATAATGKNAARRALALDLSLLPGRRPLVGVVSRLADQKGADLVAAAVPGILELGLDLVVLGSGDWAIQQELQAAIAPHRGRAALVLGFDDRLARRIYAAADLFLMPSRFEPCGLGQLIALRYGAIPVVSTTGGLLDTITDLARNGGTGIFIAELSPEGLLAAIRRALPILHDRPALRVTRRRMMEQEFSWRRAARSYIEVYTRVLMKRRSETSA